MPAYLIDLLKYAAGFFFGLTAGITAAVTTHRFTIRRERTSRLRTFRNIVNCIIFEIADWADESLIERHHASVQQVRMECARILEDIECGNRDHFDGARTVYCKLSDKEIRNYNPDQIMHSLWPKGQNPPKEPYENYELGRQRMREALEDLKKYAR